MLFNSYTFWIFFFVVFLVYWRLQHTQQNLWLLLMSNVFYGSWDWRFLSLIWMSIVVDYFVALKVGPASEQRSSASRKRWLAASVCTNMGILGFFKYYGFFVRELDSLLSSIGVSANVPTLNILLPVGISFYTFQAMSYTIDVYRGHTLPTKNLLDFALYVMFFPQLVAGPIERSTDLMPQILNSRKLRSTDFVHGLYLVVYGLFMKVVVADNMAELANGVFQSPMSQLSGLDCLAGVYAFAFQIYGDFAGYSAIARGVAKWLGFDLMVNFNLPYFAQSPREFWHRWHISLSTWLRDYLYIPLGGSQFGAVATYRNLMLTMLLGGLWHGANWTFICWGALHGILLCLDRLLGFSPTKNRAADKSLLIVAFNIVLTFHCVCLGWLLFRAENMTQATKMLTLIFTNAEVTPFTEFALATIAFYILPVMLFELWLFLCGDLDQLVKVQWPIRAAAYSYAAVMILFFHPMVSHEFIYFQF